MPTTFVADSGSAIPLSNTLNVFSAVVAAGTHPIQITGSGNTLTTNLQLSQAIAATNAANVGLAAFNSAQFTVDANGFVSFIGGGGSATNLTVDTFTAPGTNPVTPNSGNIRITGNQVAAGIVGANVIRSDSVNANTATIEIQRSATAVSANSANNGVSHFNASQFSVDANGFVSYIGSTNNLPWSDQGSNFNAASQNGYFCTASITATLPAAPSNGDIILFIMDTASVVTVKANAGQKIRIGTSISAVAGTAASSHQGDALTLFYRAPSSTWMSQNFIGTAWTVT